MTIDSYKTILQPVEIEVKEKKSSFIAKAYGISHEDDVAHILNELRKKYFDAAHHCYAYVLKNGKSKSSDDGEPHGTAGVKILSSINHFQLKDCLVVVIRYFGGIKLGVGPLSRVYYSASYKVLSLADIIIKKPHYKVNLTVTFPIANKILGLLHRNQVKIMEENFHEMVTIKCLIPVENLETLSQQILKLYSKAKIISNLNEIIFN